MVSTDPRSEANERVAKYEILGKIASGGMGSVFLGREQSETGDRWVAIKRIHPHLVARLDVVQMFLNEARILSRLDHENIAGIIDCGSEDGAPYIVMRYLHGAALSTVIRRILDKKEPLPIDLMAYVAASICDGLHYAHDARGVDGEPLGLVHRDISPQNIFITFGGKVTLLDFGVAKAAAYAGFTRTGHIKGKYGYMSPEQVEAGTLDRRSDIFSLGVVLWESLAGRHLFRRKQHIETLRAIAAASVPPLHEVNPNVTPELEKIISQALVAERRLRYQTAKAMGSDLWSYLRRQKVVIGAGDVAAVMRALYPDQKHPSESHPAITLPEVPIARAATDVEEPEDVQDLEPDEDDALALSDPEIDPEGGRTEIMGPDPPEMDDPTQQVELALRTRIEPYDSAKATIPDQMLDPKERLALDREISKTLIDSRPPVILQDDVPSLPQAETVRRPPVILQDDVPSLPQAETVRRPPSPAKPRRREDAGDHGFKLGMALLIAIACAIGVAAYTLITGYLRSR